MKNSPKRFKPIKALIPKGPIPVWDRALRHAAGLRLHSLAYIERSRRAGPLSAEQLQRLATEYDQLADELENAYGIERTAH